MNRNTIAALAILVIVSALTIWAYVPGLPGPLLLDDLPQLDGLIGQSADDPGLLINNYLISTSGPLGRPVAMATFIADAVTHGPDIWFWKYGNVMFHLISGLLVCWLTALLLQALPRKIEIDPWIAGAVVAGFWLLHPLQVSTVLYTVQRMTELSTLFVFAGLICYVKGRLLQERSVGLGWLLIAVGFIVFYPLGVLSKENALVFPVYCTLIEFFVFQFGTAGTLQRQVKAFHGVLLAAYALAAVLVLANFSSIVLDSYANRDFTLVERVLTQFRVIVIYLGQILLPAQRRMGFFHDDIAVSSSLIDPVTTLISACLLGALVASAFLLRRKLPLYAFGVLFFLASHVVESSVLGLELMFEHRNYLGSFGVYVAILATALLAVGYYRRVAIVAAVCLVGLTLLTWQRSVTWSSPNSLYQYTYMAHPESPRVNLVYANVQASVGNFPRAREMLANVGPGLGTELHSLFFDCLERGRVDDAALSRVMLVRDGLIDGHTTSSAESLAREVMSGQCDLPAQYLVTMLDHVSSARSRSSTDRRSILFTKAQLLESMNDIDAAVEQYAAAQELSDRDAIATYLAADTLARFGRLDEARGMLGKAYELEKSTRIQSENAAKEIYSGLARLYEQTRQYDSALATYAEATRAMPRRAVFHVRRAELLLRLERYDEVRKTIGGIRGGDFVDMDEYEYSLQWLADQVID